MSPGVVEVQLKDGSPFNITCPPQFGTAFGTLVKKGDKEDIGAFGKACTTADFDTNEGCDSCLTAFMKASIGQFFGDARTGSNGTMKDVPWSTIPQINFSNGCPWAQACSDGMVGSIEDKALAAGLKEMIAKCKGPKPGPDYMNAFKQVQAIIEQVGVPGGRPGGPAAESGTPATATPAAASPVASLATSVWPQTVAAIAVVATMIV